MCHKSKTLLWGASRWVQKCSSASVTYRGLQQYQSCLPGPAVRAQGLCETQRVEVRGSRPGLPSLISRMVSVDVIKTQRERDTERETDRDRQRERDSETERQTQRQREYAVSGFIWYFTVCASREQYNYQTEDTAENSSQLFDRYGKHRTANTKVLSARLFLFRASKFTA